jgi:hypothetical protein
MRWITVAPTEKPVTASSSVGPTPDQDSTAFFGLGHANRANTAFFWTARKAARIECAKHAELTSAKRTGFAPRCGLFPVGLCDSTLRVFGCGPGPGDQPGIPDNDVNSYVESQPDDPKPIPIMVPGWSDATDWSCIADPSLAPIIQMAYADNPARLYSVTSGRLCPCLAHGDNSLG